MPAQKNGVPSKLTKAKTNQIYSSFLYSWWNRARVDLIQWNNCNSAPETPFLKQELSSLFRVNNNIIQLSSCSNLRDIMQIASQQAIYLDKEAFLNIA
jgi:hypothetical protein